MRRTLFGVLAALPFFCAFGILGAQKSDQQAVQDFEIEGVGLFQCQCSVSGDCPELR
jgi:hypothetical protein